MWRRKVTYLLEFEMSHRSLPTLKVRECCGVIEPDSVAFWKDAVRKVAQMWW